MADEKDDKGRFLTGNNGGPGRPKGSRNKVSEAYLADIYEAWIKRGPDAINAMIDDRPGDFVRVVSSILPREIKVETVNDLTDEQLTTRIRALQVALGLAPADAGVAGVAGGGEAPQGSKTAH